MRVTLSLFLNLIFISYFSRTNANRLFDSQNNANGGYNVGDNCIPACSDANNNYDVTQV